MDFYQRTTVSLLAFIAGMLAFSGSCYFLLIAEFDDIGVLYQILTALFTILLFFGIVLIVASIITLLYSVFKECGEL